MSFRTCAWRACAIALLGLLLGCGGGTAATAVGNAAGNAGASGATGGSGSTGSGGSGSTTPPAIAGIATPKAVSVVTAN